MKAFTTEGIANALIAGLNAIYDDKNMVNSEANKLSDLLLDMTYSLGCPEEEDPRRNRYAGLLMEIADNLDFRASEDER